MIKFINSSAGFFRKIISHRKGRTGIVMVLLVVAAAVFAPVITGCDPYDFDVTRGLEPPSADHWLGTDKNGADIFTQLLYGTRISLLVGVCSGLGVTAAGALMGIASGYIGKYTSSIIEGLINVLLVIPTLPLMIILNNVSSGYHMMIFIFITFGWSGTARTIRAQVLSLRESGYVRAAELSGGSSIYIMLRHILPGVSGLLVMNCALSCAGFMIADAGLSFIGLGDPRSLSWGRILVKAQESAYSAGLWAWVLAPGAAIFFTVTGFMQIGYAVEDICNPAVRQSADDIRFFMKLNLEETEKIFDSMDN